MDAVGTRKSVRELKDTLISRGVDISGVFERDELEKIYQQSEKEEHAARASNDGRRSKSDTDAEAFLRYARAAELLGVSLTASDDAIAAAVFCGVFITLLLAFFAVRLLENASKRAPLLSLRCKKRVHAASQQATPQKNWVH